MSDARILLDRLLALHWRGGVTQEEAARLVGIRREEFVELSDLRHATAILENVSWRHYLGAFLYAFPECDPRATKRDAGQGWSRAGRMFTDDELLRPPHLDGTAKQRPSDKMDVGKSPPAPSSSRAAPRYGQQLELDWAA